jgi:hypothetical protein
MRVDGILWGGGQPVGLAAAKTPPPFRGFLIANGIRLPIAPLFPRLLRLRIRFLRHRPGHLLPIVPTPKPVVQLLVRNLHSQLPPTLRHRLPYRLRPFFRYRLLHPPLLFLRPYLWPHSLVCASLPPLYPQPHTTSPTATPTISCTCFINFLFGRRPAPFGRWPPPSPLHIKKALASKWYYVGKKTSDGGYG